MRAWEPPVYLIFHENLLTDKLPICLETPMGREGHCFSFLFEACLLVDSRGPSSIGVKSSEVTGTLPCSSHFLKISLEKGSWGRTWRPHHHPQFLLTKHWVIDCSQSWQRFWPSALCLGYVYLTMGLVKGRKEDCVSHSVSSAELGISTVFKSVAFGFVWYYWIDLT